MTTLDDISARLSRLEKMLATAKNVLTIDEASMLTGYSVKYMRVLISQHRIPYYRRGNRIYFNREEVEKWIMANRIPSDDEISAEARHKSRVFS
jgi:excisionase family DNA binding protein